MIGWKKCILGHFFLTLATLFAEPFFITFPSDIDWVTRSSPHFRVLYRRNRDGLAERALVAAERAHRVLSPIFPEAPELTWIVLADFSDELNGYAVDFLQPHMVIYVAPPEPAGELAELDDWFSSVILHEYTHNLHLYPARGLWAPIRAVFGSLISPNGLMPRHFHEGLATFMETEFTRGGRGRAARFSMYRRMAVEAKAWEEGGYFSIDTLDGSPQVYPQGAAAYFNGFQIYQELWRRKGAEGLREFVDSTSRLVPYFLNHPFEKVYGENYSTIWDRLYVQTSLLDEKAILRIRSQPLSTATPITRSGFSKSDLHLSPSGRLAAFRSFTPQEGERLEIWRIDSKERLKTEEAKVGGVEGMCWSSDESQILVAVRRSSRGYVTHSVDRYELATGKFRSIQLENGDHVHTLACSDALDEIVTYEEHAGEGAINRYGFSLADSKATRKDSWPIPGGSWVSGISVHKGVATFAVRRGVQSDFYRWSNSKPVLHQTTDGHFYGLRALDSEAVLAVGTSDGRDEIFIVDPTRDSLQKHVAVIGGVTSFDWKNGNLVGLNYRHGGLDLDRLAPISVPSEKLSRAKKADTVLLESTAVSPAEDYRPISTLSPKTWVPLILLVPDGVQAAFWIPGADISQRHYYEILGGFDSRGSLLGSLSYGYRFDHKRLGLVAYDTPSYLIFPGSSRFIPLARTGGSLGLSTSIDDFGVGFSLLASRLAVPQNQVTLDSVGAGVSLTYSVGFKSRPLDVSPSRGTSIAAGISYYPKFIGSSEEYSVATFRLDQYLPTPISGHAFYTSLRGGWTHGTQLYNSFFDVGGEILFAPQRPSYFNRGFYPARFTAREVLNANLEYRFPLFRVDRGSGLLPLMFRRVHAALVTDISTVDVSTDGQNRERLFQDYYASSGLELKSDWIFSYYFPSQLRLGLYHGYGSVGEPLYISLALEASI